MIQRQNGRHRVDRTEWQDEHAKQARGQAWENL